MNAKLEQLEQVCVPNNRLQGLLIMYGMGFRRLGGVIQKIDIWRDIYFLIFICIPIPF